MSCGTKLWDPVGYLLQGSSLPYLVSDFKHIPYLSYINIVWEKILFVVILLVATFGRSLWVSSYIRNKALLADCAVLSNPVLLCWVPLLSPVGQIQPFPTVPQGKAWTRWSGKIQLCLTEHVPSNVPLYTLPICFLAVLWTFYGIQVRPNFKGRVQLNKLRHKMGGNAGNHILDGLGHIRWPIQPS